MMYVKGIMADTSPFIVKGGWFPSKNVSLIVAMYREISIIILIIYMSFLCNQNIFNHILWNLNTKNYQLNFKIFRDDKNLKKIVGFG